MNRRQIPLYKRALAGEPLACEEWSFPLWRKQFSGSFQWMLCIGGKGIVLYFMERIRVRTLEFRFACTQTLLWNHDTATQLSECIQNETKELFAFLDCLIWQSWNLILVLGLLILLLIGFLCKLWVHMTHLCLWLLYMCTRESCDRSKAWFSNSSQCVLLVRCPANCQAAGNQSPTALLLLN